MINIDDLLAKDIIPDALIRIGIRSRLRETLKPFENLNCEDRQAALMRHVAELKESPLAIATDQANEQHYELPTDFFRKVLGPHMKYSSGYWDTGSTDLQTSEARMLKLSCEREFESTGVLKWRPLRGATYSWETVRAWRSDRLLTARESRPRHVLCPFALGPAGAALCAERRGRHAARAAARGGRRAGGGGGGRGGGRRRGGWR